MGRIRLRLAATPRGFFLGFDLWFGARFRAGERGRRDSVPITTRPDYSPAPLGSAYRPDPVPPLRPGTYKGGRNLGPAGPRPERPPRPMGLPGWVVQNPAPPQPPKL